MPIPAVFFLAGAVVIASHLPNPNNKDLHERKGEPGVGQQFLSKLAGTWKVEKTLTLPGKLAVKTTGDAVHTMTHGGRFLQCEFTFDTSAGKTTGTGVIGFDSASGQFTSVWWDSRQTKMSFRQSKGKFDGSKILMQAVDVDGPPVRKSRTETSLSSDGGRIVHRQFNAGTDGSENLLMELILTRKLVDQR